MSNQPTEEEPESEAQPFHVGDHVGDREDTDATLIVLGLPGMVAREYWFGAGEGKSVAQANPEYPETDEVIECAFSKRTDTDLRDAERYAYPVGRLKLESPIHDIEDDG